MRTNKNQTPTTLLRDLLEPIPQVMVQQHAIVILVGELLPIHGHANSSTLRPLDLCAI